MTDNKHQTTFYTVQKTIRFEAAHRLVKGYKGKCNNVHGHSWVVSFEVGSYQLNEHGFVKDFAEFKELKDFIDKFLDHAMLVSDDDKPMIKFLHENEQKHLVFKNNPTSEAVGHMLLDIAISMGFSITKVTVNETCTSEATIQYV
jgi:6-pyruvoyltetrahydropterin/6-carboxytetrahydropterin synthase